MTVAILGAGLVGCLAALELADRGQSVVLFDQEPALLRRASLRNEGKVHLGYVYGADAHFDTAETMILDALVFRPTLERWMTSQSVAACITQPFHYIVPQHSQLPLDQIKQHFARVDAFLTEQEARLQRGYLGRDPGAGAVQLGNCPDTQAAWFHTPEQAVRPGVIAHCLSDVVRRHPRIELRLNTSVQRAAPTPRGWRIIAKDVAEPDEGPFDTVVNATWSGRLRIDRASGFATTERWYTRFKYGVILRNAAQVLGGNVPQNSTATLGAFGDSVYYPDEDALYCSWYPAGMRYSSYDDALGAVPPPPEERHQIIRDTYAGYATIDPAYHALAECDLSEHARLIGDYIVARGCSDIMDPHSQLHERKGHGPVELAPGYWSIDTGKFTSAPRCALECADAITRQEAACLLS